MHTIDLARCGVELLKYLRHHSLTDFRLREKKIPLCCRRALELYISGFIYVRVRNVKH